MAGFLFSLIPLPFTKIFQLNILAAIYCSIAVGVFVYAIKYCLDHLSSFEKKIVGFTNHLTTLMILPGAALPLLTRSY